MIALNVSSIVTIAIVTAGIGYFLPRAEVVDYKKLNEKKEVTAKPFTHPKLTNPESLWDNDWDKRQPLVESKSSGKIRNIFLIRHGQYSASEKDIDSEMILTEVGKKQARATAARLVNSGLVFSKIMSSTMARAKETAQFIHDSFPDVETVESDFFREVFPIDPVPALPVEYDFPVSDKFIEEVAAEAGFRKLFYRPDASQAQQVTNEIVVAHGNLIRYWLMRAMQIETRAWARFGLYNCSITHIKINEDGSVKAVSIGDAGHLPQDL
ncbi:Serine/threonine-protein phosphatase pgam5, mitochondrial, partial [Lobulomyces angularis]